MHAIGFCNMQILMVTKKNQAMYVHEYEYGLFEYVARYWVTHFQRSDVRAHQALLDVVFAFAILDWMVCHLVSYVLENYFPPTRLSLETYSHNVSIIPRAIENCLETIP